MPTFHIHHFQQARDLLNSATQEEKLRRVYGTTDVEFAKDLQQARLDRLYFEMKLEDLNEISKDYFFFKVKEVILCDFLHILAATVDPKIVAAYPEVPYRSAFDYSIDLSFYLYAKYNVLPRVTFIASDPHEEDETGEKWLASAGRLLLKDPTEENVQEFVERHKIRGEATCERAWRVLTLMRGYEDLSDLVEKYGLKGGSEFLHLCGINPSVIPL